MQQKLHWRRDSRKLEGPIREFVINASENDEGITSMFLIRMTMHNFPENLKKVRFSPDTRSKFLLESQKTMIQCTGTLRHGNFIIQ